MRRQSVGEGRRLAARAMKDREYLNCGVYQSIDHDVRSARDHQLASAVNPSGTALPGKPAETLDGFEDRFEE